MVARIEPSRWTCRSTFGSAARLRVTGSIATSGGRRAPCRRSGTSGSTRPRATRRRHAAGRRRRPDTACRSARGPMKWSPIFVGRPPLRLPLLLERVGEDLADRVEQRCDAPRRSSVSSDAYGRELRPVQDVVAVAAADARRPCAGRAGSCGRGGCRRPRAPALRTPSESGSGPSLPSGPSSPSASTHHPALRSRPNSFTSTEGASSNRSRTTAPRGFVVFGGILDVDAATLRQVERDPRSAELDQRRTSRARPTPVDRATDELRGARRRRSSGTRTAGRPPPRTSHPRRPGLEPLDHRLDLGELRHQRSNANIAAERSAIVEAHPRTRRTRRSVRSSSTAIPPAAARRTISMHSSIRSRWVRWDRMHARIVNRPSTHGAREVRRARSR